MKTRAMWTARCKSGFVFNGRVCRKACPRGHLLCPDCAVAEPMQEARKASIMERMMTLALALTQGVRA